ncbi:hypothetical protein ACFVEN_44210 [Streptomyces sp. NPDC057681]|uniref:hypothetical protein n=1 Tax=Streptomyces sp. NPDC057681 TaxID=3346209 RepID=UPI0036836323
MDSTTKPQPSTPGGRWLLTADDSTHMGYTLGQLDDGTVPTYRRGTAIHEREFTDHHDRPGGAWDGPDTAQLPQPAALLPACTCEWRGSPLPYDPDGGQWNDPHDMDAFRGQDLDALGAWQEHARAAAAAVDPTVHSSHLYRLTELAGTLGELTDERPRAALNLARMLRELADHIEPLAVAQARALGVSWDTIADDLTVTRQSVHGRYVARPSQELQQRVQDLTGGPLTDLLAAAKNRRPHAPPPARKGWSDAVRRILGEPDTGRRQDVADEAPRA